MPPSLKETVPSSPIEVHFQHAGLLVQMKYLEQLGRGDVLEAAAHGGFGVDQLDRVEEFEAQRQQFGDVDQNGCRTAQQVAKFLGGDVDHQAVFQGPHIPQGADRAQAAHLADDFPGTEYGNHLFIALQREAAGKNQVEFQAWPVLLQQHGLGGNGHGHEIFEYVVDSVSLEGFQKGQSTGVPLSSSMTLSSRGTAFSVSTSVVSFW